MTKQAVLESLYAEERKLSLMTRGTRPAKLGRIGRARLAEVRKYISFWESK